jgi:hypothetical protein
MGHIDAALGEQLQHLSAGQRVGQVPPYCGQDDVGWPAIITEG